MRTRLVVAVILLAALLSSGVAKAEDFADTLKARNLTLVGHDDWCLFNDRPGKLFHCDEYADPQGQLYFNLFHNGKPVLLFRKEGMLLVWREDDSN